MRAQLAHAGAVKQGYCALRFYGNGDAETVEGTPAVEEAPLPGNGEARAAPFCYDGAGLDDAVPEPPAPGNAQGGRHGNEGSTDLSRVEAKLDALSANTERIACALEALVALMSKKQ